MTKFLLSKGANPNIKRKNIYDYPLYKSVDLNQNKITQILIENGAEFLVFIFCYFENL